MKIFTAKEAKNRLGEAIDAALTDGALMITKNGRETVVLVSADRYREMTGIQGFIQDEAVARKNAARREFADRVKKGVAKSTDASMFHGLGRRSKVRYLNEEF